MRNYAGCCPTRRDSKSTTVRLNGHIRARACQLLLLVLSLAAAPAGAALGAQGQPPPSAGSTPVPVAAAHPGAVVVGPRDTLSRLAVRFHVPAEAIARANGLAGPLSQLTVGQTVKNP